jgi:hypothetical protein
MDLAADSSAKRLNALRGRTLRESHLFSGPL